jgi:hypothetical protein
MFAVTDLYSGRPKFVARAKCKVLDNRDPKQRGRIKVDHPMIGESNWIPYLQLGFLFDLPQPGDLVYVECDGGFESYLIAWGKCLTDQAEEVPLNDVFKRTAPTNRGFYSPGGHLLEIDDGEILAPGTPPVNSIGIRFTTSGESRIHIIDDVATPGIVIERTEGQKIELDSLLDVVSITNNNGDNIEFSLLGGVTGGSPTATGATFSFAQGAINLTASSTTLDMDPTQFAMTDQLGNNITTDSSGIALTDFLGNSNTMSSSGITVADLTGNSLETTASGVTLSTATGESLAMAAASVELTESTGAGFTASAGRVTVGGPAAELLDLFDQTLSQVDAILTAIAAITVPTAVGPSGPPVNVPQFIAAQVQVNLIKTQLALIKG